jgi:exodeoxyribonuclease V beta subunit
MSVPLPLDLAGELPAGRVVLEASAGTGKTYALTALLVRSVAERRLRAEELLVVTFTRAATAELRDRIRRALGDAVSVLAGNESDEDWLHALRDVATDERAARLTAVEQAVAELDAATITTIHGFCGLTLRQVGVRGSGGQTTDLAGEDAALLTQVVRDLLIQELADDPLALDDPGSSKETTPSTIEDRLRMAVRARLNNPTAVIDPTGDVEPKVAARLRELCEKAVAEIADRRQAAGQSSYDDLVSGVADLITHPDDGPAACRMLRERYRLVMVDEFQDTDPLQWLIFSRLFAEPGSDLGSPVDLLVVGDPKQAIYRFRGADLHAYLEAVDDPDVTRLALRTNHRSDAGLLTAIGTLLQGAEFGDPRITFQPVAARPGAPDHAILDDGAPLQIRSVPRHDELLDKRGELILSSPVAKLIVADLVAEVCRLLAGVRLAEGGSTRAIRPQDLAVLVKAHDDGDEVVRALHEAGIPAVRSRMGNVFNTEAVEHWRVLLAALRRPADTDTVRALATSWFVGDDAAGVLDDEAMLHLQQRCRHWAGTMSEQGVAATYRNLTTDPLVVRAVTAFDAERRLTDLEHIAELLHTESGGVAVPPGTVARLLDQLRSEASDLEQAEDRLRRIDSDADAVQVTTIHGSKGLEFPIVLLPRLAKKRSTKLAPYVFNATDGRRHIDTASAIDWRYDDSAEGKSQRHGYAKNEADADDQRLLYVALTRAQHRVVAWWAPTRGNGTAAFTKALFGERDDDGNVDLVSPIADKLLPDDGRVVKVLEDLAQRSGHRISHRVLSATRGPLPALPAPVPAKAPVSVATISRPLGDRSWSRWSFTQLSKGVPSDGHLPVDPRGGDDEPTEGSGSMPLRSRGALADLPAGPRTGNLVHGLLEHIDAAAPDLEDAVASAVGTLCGRSGHDIDQTMLTRGLVDVLRTPLEPLAEGVRLCDFPATHRLAELGFDLHLAEAGARIDAAALADIVVEHEPQGPFAEYFTGLSESLSARRLAGRLVGSIDAVLRLPDGRFSAVDYKSNRLHPAGADDPAAFYQPESMRAAMIDHHYPLQALLYTVAVHRFLRWRLDGYDPAMHLAPPTYLFVRAMTGTDTPVVDGVRAGIHVWDLGHEAVLAVDRLLAGQA